MKILIIFSDIQEAGSIVDWLSREGTHQDELIDQRIEKKAFLRVYVLYDMHIYVSICGHTCFETSYQLGNFFSITSFHLVLYAGLCTGYRSDMQIGDIVNVIRDRVGDTGIQYTDRQIDAYEAKWLDRRSPPHQRGGFINMTNAYFNVFLPIKKVHAISVSMLTRNPKLTKERIARWNPDVETLNGVAIQYACLFEDVPFYQLRSVSYLALPNKEDIPKALSSLSDKIRALILQIK